MWYNTLSADARARVLCALLSNEEVHYHRDYRENRSMLRVGLIIDVMGNRSYELEIELGTHRPLILEQRGPFDDMRPYDLVSELGKRTLLREMLTGLLALTQLDPKERAGLRETINSMIR